MATAPLTADLLARKGQAEPTATVRPLYPSGNWQDRLKPVSHTCKKAAGKRVHKSLYLDKHVHHAVRLLAARSGSSQQHIMEQAILMLVEAAKKQDGCICGARP